MIRPSVQPLFFGRNLVIQIRVYTLFIVIDVGNPTEQQPTSSGAELRKQVYNTPIEAIIIKSEWVLETGMLTHNLAGRVVETAALWQHFQAAATGQFRIVLLAGEPGIGKTRLLHHLVGQAAQAGATTLWGGASQTEGMPPYLPFLESLGGYIRRTPLAVSTQRGQSLFCRRIAA